MTGELHISYDLVKIYRLLLKHFESNKKLNGFFKFSDKGVAAGD